MTTISAQIIADSVSEQGIRLTTMQLRELFSYDPLTGVLTHRVSRRGVKAGGRAGCLKPDGYVHVKVLGVEHYAHRIIWQIVYGDELPPMVDHRDGVKSNNRLKNLRAATSGQNAANSLSRVDNACGVKGVRRHGHRWRAAITIGGKSKHLGCFDTIDEASAAYASEAAIQHGAYARP